MTRRRGKKVEKSFSWPNTEEKFHVENQKLKEKGKMSIFSRYGAERALVDAQARGKNGSETPYFIATERSALGRHFVAVRPCQ